MITAALYLAYEPDDVKPGWIALLVVLALGVATFLLWRSMNTQLGKIKVPKRGEAPPPPEGDDPSADQAELRLSDQDGKQDGPPSSD